MSGITCMEVGVIRILREDLNAVNESPYERWTQRGGHGFSLEWELMVKSYTRTGLMTADDVEGGLEQLPRSTTIDLESNEANGERGGIMETLPGNRHTTAADFWPLINDDKTVRYLVPRPRYYYRLPAVIANYKSATSR